MTVDRRPIRRALVSVSDKTGLAELGQGLADAGVEIVSTGSTAARLRAAAVPVTAVEALTGVAECLGGRVKTLHPGVHAGLLADPRDPDHARDLAALGVAPFDLLVVNLYPFREAVASGAGVAECTEQIDVGGPAMVRAAAKNWAAVAVVVDPRRYAEVLAALAAGGFTGAERRALAAVAFARTAAYDVAVASWFATVVAPEPTPFPRFLGAALTRVDVLRYGENPHQRAALYASPDAPPGLAQAEQLHGKALSYNNYVDADAARRAVFDFADPCVAIVKHTNPCGIALGVGSEDPIAQAHRKAHACDPVSAYGGVVAANRPVTRAMADQLADVFTEVVVAPGFADGAADVLTRKPSVRLLRCPPPAAAPAAGRADGGALEWRGVSGGVLAQTIDRVDAPGDDAESWRLVAGPPADEPVLADLAFAWRAARAVKSNAVLLAADRATVGIGMGQVNRVDAARLAVTRAGGRAAGAVAASDAFFPFPDGLVVLLDAGVRAVVQPGGSVRDEAVVRTAQERNVTLYHTGVRHFWH